MSSIKNHIQILKRTKESGLAFIPFMIIGTLIGLATWITVKSSVKEIVAWVLHDVLAVLASNIMALAGLLLDHVIEFAINFNIGGLEAVITGWTVIRDLCNLVFIFILLFIAIATILRIVSYGMKELLVKVIIIALLLNFSLMITKFIIDASNIVAMEFYTAAGGGGDTSISQNITAGLDLQKIEESVRQQEGDKTMIIIKISFFEIILFLVTAYVFFLGVFLLVVRMIAFIFLMILAPIAFLAMILPKTQTISKRWWSTLFNQCLVAPVYLFFIFIVVKIIQQGILKTEMQNTLPTSDPNKDTHLILNFIVLIGLMWASVKATREIGGRISEQAVGWGNKLGGLVAGFAGGMALGAGRLAAVRGGGAVAEKFVESKAAQRIAGVPLVGKTIGRALTEPMARLAATRQKEIDKAADRYKGYSPKTLATVMPTLSAPLQKAVVGKLKDEQLSKMIGAMKTNEQKIAFGQRILKQDEALGMKVAKATNDISLGARMTLKEGDDYQKHVNRYVDNLSKAELKRLNYENLDKDEAAITAFLSRINTPDFQSTLTRKNIEDLSKTIKAFSASRNMQVDMFAEEIIKKQFGNESLGNYLSSAPGKNIILAPEKVIVSRGRIEFEAPQPPPASPPTS